MGTKAISLSQGVTRPSRGDVAARRAGAEGDPEDAAVVQRHRAHQRGHVSVVDHVEGDAVPGALQIAEHVLHPAIEQLGRDAPEQRRELHLAVDVDARGAAADRVDAREVLGGAAERVHDPAPVVVGVGLVVGVPLRLLAPDDAAVDERRHLAVAAAEVEPDAAPLEVPAEVRGARALRRKRRGGHDLDRAVVDALADDLGVEASRRGVAKVPAQPVDELGRRVEVDAEAAARPERELDQTLEHSEVVVVGPRRARGEEVCREAGDRAVPLLEREAASGAAARCRARAAGTPARPTRPGGSDGRGPAPQRERATRNAAPDRGSS